MGKYQNDRRVRRVAMVLLVSVLLESMPMSSVVQASASVHMSVTKRSYFLHGVWDKLTLKNVPTGAKIRWKSSDKKVVRIREHIRNGIWYQVKSDGRTTITAICKGKKYKCRIYVKRKTEDASVTPTPVATEIPHEENPVSTTPAQTEEPDETKPAATPDVRQTSTPVSGTPAPAASVSPNQMIYDQRIADFKERYITEDMSDYDKVDAICRFISYEFDYGKEAGWFSMVVKGYGDCMASRIGVNRLCTEFGISSYICRDLNDHGETMVRIGDEIYMTVTGYGGEKPRPYRIYMMSEAELAAKIERYPSCRLVLGLD